MSPRGGAGQNPDPNLARVGVADARGGAAFTGGLKGPCPVHGVTWLVQVSGPKCPRCAAAFSEGRETEKR